MNKARRSELEKISSKLIELMEMVDDLKDEEEEYRDNIPENMQGGEKYERADEVAYSLEEACDYIQNAVDEIESATA